MQIEKIVKVSGPLILTENMSDTSTQDICRVGDLGVIGEITEMRGDVASIQAYEETTGIGPGESVISTGEPLSVELTPGLIAEMFDGIQRLLDTFQEITHSNFLGRGVKIDALDREKKWTFEPTVAVGEEVSTGDIVGVVQETPIIQRKIMVPFGVSGTITEIKASDFAIDETVYSVKTAKGTESFSMMQEWPVRRGHPTSEKLSPKVPMVTEQRVIDTFSPITKGGTTAVPGPFGVGKTVVQHQIVKWADVDLVVYVGCGERGNEMTDVLNEFPELIDPATGESLMNRMIPIVNTLNMPAAAREASIYTGITIAEYFRGMGYSVVIMTDSTSRWAEVLREVSGRLGEIPGDEGYPAYLGSRPAEYYGRVGQVIALGKDHREGSITAISAVSPSGGDTSEPATQDTLRVIKVFWGLDSQLAQKRHFPSINWLQSYSLYSTEVGQHLDLELQGNQAAMIAEGAQVLQEESQLEEIVRLVEIDSLPDKDRLTLEAAKSLREDYLQQNAFDGADTFASRTKQAKMLQLVLTFGEEGQKALSLGTYFSELIAGTVEIRNRITRSKYLLEEELEELDRLQAEIKTTIKKIIAEGGMTND